MLGQTPFRGNCLLTFGWQEGSGHGKGKQYLLKSSCVTKSEPFCLRERPVYMGHKIHMIRILCVKVTVEGGKKIQIDINCLHCGRTIIWGYDQYFASYAVHVFIVEWITTLLKYLQL
jgi:hypothetical protein